MVPTLILINPWIYDFAAYDLWAKPLGLLYLASQLRSIGFEIHLIDCMDIYSPHMHDSSGAKKPVRRLYGTGKFWKQIVNKPAQLAAISRPYSRYGITPQAFIAELKKIKQPSAILVTSLMTYWYPGVFEAIRYAKKYHPGVPVILGGIYAILCPEHAVRYSGADLVISSPCRFFPKELIDFLQHTIPEFPVKHKFPTVPPYPAFDLLRKIDYVCLLSSTGCPFTCAYCASPHLYPLFQKRDPLELLEEVLFWHTCYNIIDFAFYDDALLVDAEHHISLFLQEMIKNRLSLRFHCPNGLHVAYIDKNLATLLKQAGFTTLRLGLETSNSGLHEDLGRKFPEGAFAQAVANLKNAGFTADQIGAYILAGLPGQTSEQVRETIRYAAGAGALPYLSEYSPLPRTRLWHEAIKTSRYDLACEPLFHNNTLFPCWREEQLGEVRRLKDMARACRSAVRSKPY